MTNRQAAEEERLREAFQALAETSGRECAEEDVEHIWRAVSGDLPGWERREIVDRMAGDPAVAELWRLAQELHRPLGVSAVPDAPSGVRSWPLLRPWASPRPWVSPSWLAAAAALVLAIGVGLVFQFDRPPHDEFRDAGTYIVKPLVPPEVVLPRDAFELRWAPGPPGSRYRVRVTTEDLSVLTTVTDLTVSEVVIGADVLSGVPQGARVLWQVDVELPGGERVSSQTFSAQVK